MFEFQSGCFFAIIGRREARLLAQRLIDASILFCVEPHPDDQWCFYVKKENFKRLGNLATDVIKEVRG